MGGQIAMKWIIQNDNSINRLVLLAPAGIEQFSDVEKQITHIAPVDGETRKSFSTYVSTPRSLTEDGQSRKMVYPSMQ